MGNPSPKRNRFPPLESSRMDSRKRREALIHSGEEEKSFGWGRLELKVENEDSNWFLRKNVGLLCQVLSLIQGERTLSASLPGCSFSPSSPTSVFFFFFQLALGLASILLDPKQWNLAVPPVVLLCNIAYSCLRFSAKAEPFAPASD